MNGESREIRTMTASAVGWRCASGQGDGLRTLGHLLMLLVGLCGPAIGAFGIYGANLLVAAALPLIALQTKQFALRPELFGVLLLGLGLATYVLCWATVAGGPMWAYSHLAILLLSGSAFFVHALLADHRGAAGRILGWLSKFTWAVLCLAILESVTGLRLPVSRYSALAPSLGFAFEGHDGSSPLIDGLWIPTGFFGNQNNLAFAVLCLLPFALAAQRTVLSRHALVVLSGTVIFLSESRTALIVGVGWMLVVLGVRVLRLTAPLAVLAIAMLGVASWVFGQSLLDAMCAESSQKLCFAIGLLRELSLSDLELGQDSISVRYQLARQALALWGESPVFGVGPGHLGSLISAFHSEGVVITDAHNAPLQVLTEYGLVGSGIWLVGALIVAATVLRVREDESMALRFKDASKTFCVLLPFASITVSTLYYFVPVWVLAGTVFGVALGERDDKRRARVS